MFVKVAAVTPRALACSPSRQLFQPDFGWMPTQRLPGNGFIAAGRHAKTDTSAPPHRPPETAGPRRRFEFHTPARIPTPHTAPAGDS